MQEKYMQEALKEAKKAYDIDEVPVGAVIVHNDTIIARAHNLRETNKDPFGHAEMIAIKKASKILNSWKLNDCTLYVTLEPCIMCAGSIIQSRIGTVVYGASDKKGGSFGSTTDLRDIEGFNHYPHVNAGVLEKEATTMLKDFFRRQRETDIKIKKIDTEDDFEKVKRLRYEVFVIEQEIDPTIEFDMYDDINRLDVIHVIAKTQEEAVGSLRLLLKGKTVTVGRVVVKKSHRKQGIGDRLLKYAEKYAFNNGFVTLELGAQLSALKFYEKSGYEAYGDIFLDADIEHKMMKKKMR